MSMGRSQKHVAAETPEGPPPAAAARPGGARWLPAVGLGALFAALAVQQIGDTDVWWQLRTGQWIAEHGAVPTHDVLSYTVNDHPWIELRWLFCLLLYLGWQAGGPTLLILAKTAVLAATFALVLRTPRRWLAGPAGVALAALGVAGMECRFGVRPELVTYLLMAVFLTVLEGRRQGGCRRAVWALPALQVVWTNSHGLFVFGPVIAGAFLLEAAAERLSPRFAGTDEVTVAPRSRVRTTAVLTLLILLACLANPYGLAGALFPLTLFRELHEGSIFSAVIAEMLSPFTPGVRWSYGFWAAAGLAMVGAASFVWRRRGLRLSRVLLWLGTLYLAATSARNVGLFALVGLWVTLRNLEDHRAADAARPSPTARGRFLTAAGSAVSGLLLLAAAWYVASDRYAADMEAPRAFGLGVLESETPRAAVDFLREAAPQGELFHSMADGSYLSWAASDRYRVHIDGRLEVYGEAFYAPYVDRAALARNWAAYADRFGIRTAVLLRAEFQRLAEKLMASPDWVLVHLDARNLVFVRNLPEHGELIARYRIDPTQPWAARGAEPSETPRGWRRWFGSVQRPWHSFGMAKSFLTVGGVDNAERYLRQAVERYPRDRSMRLILAAICRSRGASAEAEQWLADTVLTSEELRRLNLMVASMLKMWGRPAAAAEALERVLRDSPDHAEGFRELGALRSAAGDYPAAIRAYEAAVRLQPDEVEAWLELGRLVENLGNHSAAAGYYRRSLELDPHCAPAREGLARLGSGMN